MPRFFRFCMSLAWLWIAGCAGRKQVKPSNYVIMLERPCLEKVELTDKTKCAGDDKNTLHCTDLRLTYRPSCAKVQVTK